MQGVIILFFALVAWGSSFSWGSCVPFSLNNYSGVTGTQCSTLPSQLGQSYGGHIVCANYQSPNNNISGACNLYGTDKTPHSSCGKMSGYDAFRCWTDCVKCDYQCDIDSLNCVNSGNSWAYDGGATCGGMSCQEPCDTTMQCIEYPFNRCEDVASSGSVYCDENGCSGLPFSRWFSELRTECQNECGEFRTNSITGDTLISFDSSCNDTTQCSDETKCIDFPNSGTYALYKVCIVGNEQIGNGVTNKSYPQFIGGGTGNCASLGLNSDNIQNPMNNTNNNVFPNHDNNNNIDDNCLLYGIDCPPDFVDTTDYNNNSNRSPDHCICERLDGMNHISTIVCPDGSRTTFFGSCDEWKLAHSSSSVANSSSGSTNPPESSSSDSENSPTSSGGISGEYPDWPEIRKNQRNTNDVLGSIVQSLKTLPSSIVSGIREILNGYNYNDVDDGFLYERRDSVLTLDTILDTAGLLHAIFGRIDSNNTILDTLQHSNFSGCPTCTFFAGNPKNDFSGGHIRFKEIKFELGNIHGFNLCRIFSVVVTALASVVSFFIGFSIFKNISQ